MKNILITGGGMGNKGAQSMTFICVSELKKRYPNDRLVLLTLASNNDKYNFDIQKISYPALKSVINPVNPIKLLFKRIKKDEIKKIESLYQNARMLIDISGYALGSNWADATVDYYLSCFECAKKYQVPVYVMPQSFGPFLYKKDSLIMKRIQSTMSYPAVIYARESEGFELMTSLFKLKNIRKSCDMVLRCASADPTVILKDKMEVCIPSILPNSCAVIPNIRNFDNKDPNVVLNYYKVVVNKLLEIGKNVYIMHHSKEDASICEKIKKCFGDSDEVIILKEDFDCFEYEKIVAKFDYIIASRYHSLIHALKNGIPCIALGWATKYAELLNLVGQKDCVLDVRDNIDDTDINSVIDVVDCSLEDRKRLIGEAIRNLQIVNLFDEIMAMEETQHGECDMR